MPFWKKTGKGGKKKPPKSAVSRTAQQSIPMQRMFEDGTCRVKPNYYTRTIQYRTSITSSPSRRTRRRFSRNGAVS